MVGGGKENDKTAPDPPSDVLCRVCGACGLQAAGVRGLTGGVCCVCCVVVVGLSDVLVWISKYVITIWRPLPRAELG